MIKIYLVRHGEASEGWTSQDPPLSELGKSQAKSLMTFVDSIFDENSTNNTNAISSPLNRCKETASLALEKKYLEIEIKDNFRELIVGVSTHTKEGALLAEAEGADFITFSPIYETPSKIHFGPPQGTQRLGEIVKSVHLPVLALGGIKLNRVPEVLEQGAHGVAVISGSWDSQDIKQQAFEYMHHFGGVTS